MASIVTLKALGLNTSPNSIDVPEGSLLVAKNVIIRRDNVVESRRGFSLYGSGFGTSTSVLKQLLSYKQQILRHYSNILQYQSGDEFFNFNEPISETDAGLRLKSLEMNSNLYLTSSEGIKKISAKRAQDLSSTKITNAGGIKALDTEAKLNITQGDTAGFLSEDSSVSYRVVWVTRDANNNLILGTPSPLVEVYNSLNSLNLRDYQALLNALDLLQTGSLIDDGNYMSSYSLPYNSVPEQIKNNLIALGDKIDSDILYADDDTTPGLAPLTLTSVPVISGGVCTVTFTASPNATDYFSTGSRIKLSGFTVSDTSKNFDSTTDVNTSTDRITISSHGFESGDVATFSGTLPTGLSLSTSYYVINPTTNDFQISSTPDGAPVDITATAVGTGTITVTASGTINGLQSVVQVTNTYITFNTTAKGTVSMTAQKVTSGEYSYIIENPETENLNDYIIDTPPTNDQLKVIQDKIERIYARLKDEPDAVIPEYLRSAYIDSLLTTRAASVDLYITIPDDITSDYFFQIYRSALVSAEGVVSLEDLSPGDELRQVYEAYPTATELDSRTIVVTDVVPESFRLNGANLYTNAATGDGPLQANDVPPFAKDIELFKGHAFYANTKTRHRMSLSLLGVSKLIESYNNGNSPSLTVSNGTSVNSYSFVIGQKEITQYDFNGLTGSTANGKGAQFASASDLTFYRFFINTGIASIGTGSNPTITTNDAHGLSTGNFVEIAGSNSTPTIDGTYSITVTGPTTFDIAVTSAVTVAGSAGNWNKHYNDSVMLRVDVNSSDSDSDIADKVRDKINSVSYDFSATSSTSITEVTNFEYGYCSDATADSGIAVTISQQGRGDKAERQVTELDFTGLTGSSFTSSGSADHLFINEAFDKIAYYIYFLIGTATDPAISGRIGIPVTILSGDTDAQLAQKVKSYLDTNYSDVFETDISGALLTITNVKYGRVTSASVPQMPGGFSISTTVSGALEVLLSDVVSPAQAVNDTSKSLVKIINKNTSEIVNGFYLSSSSQIPGSMNIEARGLSDIEFYLSVNDEVIGPSFNPDISPEVTGITNTAANPTVITATAHGLSDGDQVVISGSNSFPNIDGLYTVSNVSANTFTIPVHVITPGTEGAIIKALSSEVSSNDEDPHRIYYSKLQQPEAVPILNYFEVGAKDKAILRIFALRDSLFVFKEDGLYRVSGETPPWTVSLFDSSCILVAPDSLDVSNNQLFGWTTQGISAVSEGGVQIISRPIDIDIIPRASANYSNFKTATWGLGYDSDNSYIVFTVSKQEDDVAMIAYRYSNLTNSWTTWDKSSVCGIINPADDKMYLGPSDTNYIEKERKTFSRLDYADRELSSTLSINNYLNSGKLIKLASVEGISEGDVLYQKQNLTAFEFNMLLSKLDLDPNITTNDFKSTLEMGGGDNARSKIVALASKLDTDITPTPSPTYSSIIQSLNSIPIVSNSAATPTVVYSPGHGLITGRRITISGVTGSYPDINGDHSVTVIDNDNFSIPIEVLTAGTGGSFSTDQQDFDDVETCYNAIITKLNNDGGVSFSNYQQIDTETEMEAVITSVNKFTKQVALNIGIAFLQGPLTIFKAIDTEILYTPVTMGDPLNLKHLREATIMFSNRAFTAAKLSFATDLAPAYTEVAFNGDGNGIFGYGTFGEGYFGGASNSAPLRTYVPRPHQRCRAMNIRFNHKVAREIFAIYGITLTGEVGQSSRAYR